MMIHVHHIIWVVSWKQIANFVLICEQVALAIANDVDANARIAHYKIKITDSIPILYFEIFLKQLYWCLENDLVKIIALSTVITD